MPTDVGFLLAPPPTTLDLVRASCVQAGRGCPQQRICIFLLPGGLVATPQPCLQEPPGFGPRALGTPSTRHHLRCEWSQRIQALPQALPARQVSLHASYREFPPGWWATYSRRHGGGPLQPLPGCPGAHTLDQRDLHALSVILKAGEIKGLTLKVRTSPSNCSGSPVR